MCFMYMLIKKGVKLCIKSKKIQTSPLMQKFLVKRNNLKKKDAPSHCVLVYTLNMLKKTCCWRANNNYPSNIALTPIVSIRNQMHEEFLLLHTTQQIRQFPLLRKPRKMNINSHTARRRQGFKTGHSLNIVTMPTISLSIKFSSIYFILCNTSLALGIHRHLPGYI